jgi:ABC-type dipeptide/oligopeptide/nickel transport system ATPase component
VTGADIENANGRPQQDAVADHPPSGCRFRTRYPLATETCAYDVPDTREVKSGRSRPTTTRRREPLAQTARAADTMEEG